MTENRKEILFSYIRANVAPLLVDFIFGKNFDEAIVLPADINVKELNGHYEETQYLPPNWLKELMQSQSKLLIIDQIDTISKEEQLKFCELLEYRKISTFELPKNCVIIVTANEINKDKISEEVFSLVARI